MGAQVAATGHAVTAAAADDVTLAAHEVADLEVADVRAEADDLADELVPDDHRHGNRLARPLVPVVDVEIGAADPRLPDADQDVVDPDVRLGNVLEPEAFGGLRFDERPHARVTLPIGPGRGVWSGVARCTVAEGGAAHGRPLGVATRRAS